MKDNVIKFVPPQREQQQETIEPKRKVKLLRAIWGIILDGIGESLLPSGFMMVFLALLYVLLCFWGGESPFNDSELPYLGLGFLWGFFSVTLNYDLRKK